MGSTEEKKRLLEESLHSTFGRAIVVSGPLGCGKTRLIKETALKNKCTVVELDTVEEYAEHRLGENTVYLIRVSNIERKTSLCRAYKGVVFETESAYLHRKLPGSLHIQLSHPTQKHVKEVFPHASAPSAKHSGPRPKGRSAAGRLGTTNMHRASILSEASPSVQSVLADGLGKESVSFFHAIGKVLYRKTPTIPDEVISVVETSPYKTMMYIHENVPWFVPSTSALANILECISTGVFSRSSTQTPVCTYPLEAYQTVCAVWKEKQALPGRFFNIKSSSFYVSSTEQ
ncbi:hypothetical protein NECID01_1625 [Nematocida sp. AWRm77]|nr:hypothetical protein NECID01_1625 [Nematocida sp. AWRm77]